MKILLQLEVAPPCGWFLRLEWVPNDLWIGIYWKVLKGRLDLWMCLIPCFPIHYASPTDE